MSGCASAHQPIELADSLIQPGEPEVSVGDPIGLSVNEDLYRPRSTRPDPVEVVQTVVRAPAAGRLEDNDPELSLALTRAQAWPTPRTTGAWRRSIRNTAFWIWRTTSSSLPSAWRRECRYP